MSSKVGTRKRKLSMLADRLQAGLRSITAVIRVGSVVDIRDGPRPAQVHVEPLAPKPRYVAVVLNELDQRTTFLLEDADEEEVRLLHGTVAAALTDIFQSVLVCSPSQSSEPEPLPQAQLPEAVRVTFRQHEVYEYACSLDETEQGVERLSAKIKHRFSQSGWHAFQHFVNIGVFIRNNRFTKIRRDVRLNIATASQSVGANHAWRRHPSVAPTPPDSS